MKIFLICLLLVSMSICSMRRHSKSARLHHRQNRNTDPLWKNTYWPHKGPKYDLTDHDYSAEPAGSYSLGEKKYYPDGFYPKKPKHLRNPIAIYPDGSRGEKSRTGGL